MPTAEWVSINSRTSRTPVYVSVPYVCRAVYMWSAKRFRVTSTYLRAAHIHPPNPKSGRGEPIYADGHTCNKLNVLCYQTIRLPTRNVFSGFAFPSIRFPSFSRDAENCHSFHVEPGNNERRVEYFIIIETNTGVVERKLFHVGS